MMSKLKLTKRDFNEVSNIIMKLFPEFQDELFEELDPNRQNLHGLFQDFTYYYGKYHSTISNKNLIHFAELINQSVTKNDVLENAISTCFLEHLYQIQSAKPIITYLTKQAKNRLYP